MLEIGDVGCSNERFHRCRLSESFKGSLNRARLLGHLVRASTELASRRHGKACSKKGKKKKKKVGKKEGKENVTTRVIESRHLPKRSTKAAAGNLKAARITGFAIITREERERSG
jgi:hypothetical protein